MSLHAAFTWRPPSPRSPYVSLLARYDNEERDRLLRRVRSQAAIKNTKVLVFSKTYCPHCARVKALFEDLEANHEVVELDTRPDGAEIQALLLEMTKQRTVPNVFIKGKHIGGCDDTIELYANNELEALLKS
ncbi:TPA: hypothetical protein N0F65_001605 [Lagenidium giganteum]|uniref:Glutaredoxin domain-containing protein n=1 Tax=Lagenidium giganteum TaxID=4803 RepID=A0AAV2Z4Y9_9STRA|nr:TPA: hypothetical protein N0F65_001605 [Lagenidium giganteum]